MPMNMRANSHSAWNNSHAAEQGEPQTLLGGLILLSQPFTVSGTTYTPWNLYGGAQRFGAGGGNGDKDFWEEMIQNDYRPQAWQHRGQAVQIVRALRIPYVVQMGPGKSRTALDHLLIGYTDLSGTTTLGGGTWGANSPHQNNDLGYLGRLIAVDLNPSEDKSQIGYQWIDRATASQDPEGYDTPAPKTWAFRGVPHNVEKSVRIPFNSSIPGTNQFRVGSILVGYEGGGGW